MTYTDEDLKLIMKRAQERMIKVNQEELDNLIKEDYRKSINTLAEQCGTAYGYAKRLIDKLDEEYGIKNDEYLNFKKESPYSIIYDADTWSIQRKYHYKCLLCGSVNHTLRICDNLIK